MLSVKHISRCVPQVQPLKGLICFKGNRIYFTSLGGTVLDGARTIRRLDHYVPVRHLLKKKPEAGTSFEMNYAKEGIPGTYEVIYHNTMKHWYQSSVPSFVVGYILVLFIMYKIVKEHNNDREGMRRRTREAQVKNMKNSRYEVSEPIQFVYVGLPFLTAILIGTLIVSKNIIVRMYYDVSSRQYIGKLLHFGVFKETIKFTQGDIQHIHKAKSSMWKGNVKVKGRWFMVLENYFKSLRDFNRFLSYDLDRHSDIEKQAEMDNVQGSIQRGLKEYQDSQYRSFEEKYKERRALRRAEK